MSNRILAIETSCDETAAAVVEDGRRVLSNIISSQIDLHTLYGGVVPEIASRKHIEKIVPVTEEALKQSHLTLKELDAIAVTCGPGLIGAVLVGVSFAKALALGTGLPLVGVNHIEGHIAANFIEYPELEPPFMCLVVSGGHTHLTIVRDYGKYEILGITRDDAAGEAFDKVARAIGLGYPGGPKIDRISDEGDPGAIPFPRAKVDDGEYDFSFSGLKSAVLNYINSCKMKNEEYSVPDVAASFQAAVIDVLVRNSMDAMERQGMKSFAIAGGVASNRHLRERMSRECAKRGYKFYHPTPVLCTDNAAMIGCAGYYDFLAGKRADMSLNAYADLPLADIKAGEKGNEEENGRTIAVVLAAGSGRRMGGDTKKQYMLLKGHPVIYYSLKTFEESFIDGIVLVVSPGDEEYVKKEIVDRYGFKKVKAVIPGGKERYHSVFNGIGRAMEMEAGYIFIHDGARAFVTEDILERCLEEVKRSSACVAAVPVKDTIKSADDGCCVEATLNRELLWSVQTPQVFEARLISSCYGQLIEKEEELISDGISITDDTMAVEHFGHKKVKLVMGSYDNIKLTTPEDITIGERILEKQIT